jgi:hypothetical protein
MNILQGFEKQEPDNRTTFSTMTTKINPAFGQI